MSVIEDWLTVYDSSIVIGATRASCGVALSVMSGEKKSMREVYRRKEVLRTLRKWD